MFATSPPGSTTAARLVAVHATIEQFCWIGVTGTTVTLSGCIRNASRERIRSASYREPVLLREGFERGLGARAKMLDASRRRERAEPRGGAVVLAAREAHQESGGEQVARNRGVDQPVDRRGLDRLLLRAGDHYAAFLAARHHRELHVIAQRRGGGVEIGGLVQALELALVGEDEVELKS